MSDWLLLETDDGEVLISSESIIAIYPRIKNEGSVLSLIEENTIVCNHDLREICEGLMIEEVVYKVEKSVDKLKEDKLKVVHPLKKNGNS